MLFHGKNNLKLFFILLKLSYSAMDNSDNDLNMNNISLLYALGYNFYSIKQSQQRKFFSYLTTLILFRGAISGDHNRSIAGHSDEKMQRF